MDRFARLIVLVVLLLLADRAFAIKDVAVESRMEYTCRHDSGGGKIGKGFSPEAACTAAIITPYNVVTSGTQNSKYENRGDDVQPRYGEVRGYDQVHVQVRPQWQRLRVKHHDAQRVLLWRHGAGAD
jgi:hypothetical protein